MPHAVMVDSLVPPVNIYTEAIEDLLERAKDIKPHGNIGSPITDAELGSEVDAAFRSVGEPNSKGRSANYPIIETALRNTFYSLVASTSIDDTSFGQVWNLLDIVNILTDRELCDAALTFWLLEELFESQTIVGCQTIFDYLDSRRERMTAKQWKSKHLIVLRTCNDLLRRLSRADDTVFCGRVFIYLFQSFPLGDRSSVNLRGEYHVENKTTYDDLPETFAGAVEDMEVDGTSQPEAKTKTASTPQAQITITPADESSKVAIKDDKQEAPKKSLDLDSLYRIFWSLQNYFSQPVLLFQAETLQAFKSGLEVTLTKFKEVQKDLDGRSNIKVNDQPKTGSKRKWDDVDQAHVRAFNPKYLTSRDLFELEISDISFRRHVLVQSLILIDFLLSQTPKAKAKQALLVPDLKKPGENLKPNKSVIYENFVLSDTEAAWATSTKAEIASYLQQGGTEGKFYYRMVDTVLSRDKNWVFWKAHGCPPFELPPIPPEEFLSAEASVEVGSKPKRLRATPMGAFDISFLNDQDGTGAQAKLRDPDRAAYPPPLNDFERKLADNDFELGFAQGAEREALLEQRRSQKWRSLRVARREKLGLFDKVEDGEKIEVLFRGPEKKEEAEEGKNEQGADVKIDKDDSADSDEQKDDVLAAEAGVNGTGTTKVEAASDNIGGGAEQDADVEMVDAKPAAPATTEAGAQPEASTFNGVENKAAPPAGKASAATAETIAP